MDSFYNIIILALKTGGILLFVFIFTLLKAKNNRLKYIFLIVTALSTAWSFFNFYPYLYPSGNYHLLSLKAETIIFPFIIGLCALFVAELTKVYVFKRTIHNSLLIFFPAFVNTFFIVTGLYDMSGIMVSGIGDRIAPTLFFLNYYLYNTVGIIVSLIMVYTRGMTGSNRRTWYFSNIIMISCLAALATSAISFIVLYISEQNLSHAISPLPLLVFIIGLSFAVNKDRKRAVEKNLSPETIINSVSEGVLILDETKVIKKLNRAMLNIVECAFKTDIINKPLDAFIQKDISLLIENDLSKKEIINEKELFVVFFNGRTRNVSLSARSIKDDFDNITGYILFFKDISQLMRAQNELIKTKEELEFKVQERTQQLDDINTRLIAEVIEKQEAEKRIRESEEMLRLIIEIAQDAIYTVDVNGVINSVNQAMVDITGFSREEYIGRNFAEFMHPDELKYAWEIHHMIQNKIKPPIFELRYLHKKGNYHIAEFSASPIIKNGLSIGTLGVGRDITQRKKDENALKEREQWYRSIVENASEIIFNITMQGQFNFISNNIAELWGYTPDDVIGKSIYDFIHPDDLSVATESLTKPVKSRILTEFRLISKNNETLYMRVSSKVIDKDGAPHIISGTMTNITDIRRTEEMLRRIIEEKNILLKEVHHRVKNNLQVVISLLKLETLSLKDPQTISILNGFVERLNSMKLVHEHLYLSENIKEIDVRNYIAELVAHIKKTFIDGYSSIVIGTQVDDLKLNLDTLIPIGLILNELLTNSIKHAFSDKKGNIDISFTHKNGMINFQYSDNGRGFDSTLMHNSRSNLGFKLIYALVNQLEAEMEANTEQGTSFIIKFSA